MLNEYNANEHIAFMERALCLAQTAAQLGEVPVGAVIVKDGEIIAEGYNRREADKNAVKHAEMIAIDEACRRLGGWRLWQCSMYVTLEPCPMCAGAVINSRIKTLVFGAYDKKAGCCGSVTNLFEMPFNHSPLVIGGVCEEQAAKQLSDFFAQLREKMKINPKDTFQKPWKNAADAGQKK